MVYDHKCIPDTNISEEEDVIRCVICGEIIENDDSKPLPLPSNRPKWSSLPPPDFDGCDT